MSSAFRKRGREKVWPCAVFSYLPWWPCAFYLPFTGDPAYLFFWIRKSSGSHSTWSDLNETAWACALPTRKIALRQHRQNSALLAQLLPLSLVIVCVLPHHFNYFMIWNNFIDWSLESSRTSTSCIFIKKLIFLCQVLQFVPPMWFFFTINVKGNSWFTTF